MSSGLVPALEALSRVERHALIAGCAQMRDEDVAAGRHGRAAVWAALVADAAEVSARERVAFDELEAGFWSARDVSDEGGV